MGLDSVLAQDLVQEPELDLELVQVEVPVQE